MVGPNGGDECVRGLAALTAIAQDESGPRKENGGPFSLSGVRSTVLDRSDTDGLADAMRVSLQAKLDLHFPDTSVVRADGKVLRTRRMTVSPGPGPEADAT